MSGKNARIIIALICILVGGLLMSGVLRVGPVEVSPAAPRKMKELEKLLGPPPPPATNALGKVPQLTWKRTDNGLQLTFTDSSPEESPFHSYTLHEIPFGGEFKLGDGSVRFDFLAHAAPDPAVRRPGSESARPVPATFYKPDLSLMPPDEVLARFTNEWERRLYVQDIFPKYRFLFAATNAPEIKLLRGHAHDARTGAQIAYAYSHGSSRNFFEFSPTIGMWHKGPVVLALDIAHGPVEIVEIPAEIGRQISHQLGRLELVARFDGRNQGISSRWGGNDGKTEVTLHGDLQTNAASLVFYGLPYSHYAPVDFQFLNDKRQLLEAGGSSSSARLSIFSVAANVEEVKTIRVKQYAGLKRLYIRLPHLPGTPPENDSIRDLLDLRIPYVELRGDWELRSVVQFATQMTVEQNRWRPVPANLFPRSFTNTTPRALLDELRNLSPDRSRIIINQEENKIEVRQPFLSEMWERIRRL